MAAFVGKWEHAAFENWPAYLTALCIPENLREMMTCTDDKMEISNDGDVWTIYSNMGGNETTVVLKTGEMGEYKTHTGDPMKGIIKSVGDTIVEEHFFGEMKVDCVREIINDQLCVTYTANGVSGKLIYNRK